MEKLRTVKIEPIRSLKDFVLQARFQLPDHGNPDRWNNRITANLIYYQTNYFLLSILIFTLFVIAHPVDMFAIISLLTFIVVLKQRLNPTIRVQNNNINSNIAIFFGFFLLLNIFSLFKGLIVLMSAIGISFLISFTHASLRMRNTKNKIVNIKAKLTKSESCKSPMEILLDACGLKYQLAEL